MPDITLNIGDGGAPVSGKVELNIDWSALGSAFANAGSEDQADFLDAVQTGFGDYANTYAELMQMSHIADAVRADARVALRTWLIRMADALYSPGESASRTPASSEPSGAVVMTAGITTGFKPTLEELRRLWLARNFSNVPEKIEHEIGFDEWARENVRHG